MIAKQYSIAEARDHFPGIVHEAERGADIELTRRGRPVAMLISLAEYQRLTATRPTLWETIEAWRASVDPEVFLKDGEELVAPRDRSPGRDIAL